MPALSRGCSVALVVGGSFALAASLMWFFYYLPKTKAFSSSTIALAIEKRLDDYHDAFGAWPEGGNTDILLALRGNNPESRAILKESDGFPITGNALVDGWENPFHFRTGEDGRPVPISPGPNGQPGDADDIDSSEAAAFLEKAKSPPSEVSTSDNQQPTTNN